ncbi:YfcE family phosphodiesterase [Tundrisphaera lichenicola]|uniref:YfcE family phosphodiesterase n=1 Tax=Tundrisphaera lichenicola TaxID=2029860 RepID=UPI003EB96659
MKVGILSDTHDEVERTSRAVAELVGAGAEALIHCGDLTVPAVVLECGGLPSYYVFGNNDYQQEPLRRAMDLVGGLCLDWGGEIVLGGRRIAVTHGDSNLEIRRLTLADPDYFLFGHSHQAADERRGATRWINPGALSRARPKTVALLDLQTDVLEFLTIADRP